MAQRVCRFAHVQRTCPCTTSTSGHSHAHPLPLPSPLQLTADKQTNLCLSVDVTSTAQLLALARQCGPHIRLLENASHNTVTTKPRKRSRRSTASDTADASSPAVQRDNSFDDWLDLDQQRRIDQQRKRLRPSAINSVTGETNAQVKAAIDAA